MSWVRIGHRVRIIHADRREYEFLIGIEAVINELDSIDDIGRIGVGVITSLGEEWVFFKDELEPIIYDGAQPIAESFEEMMGKLREGVVA